MKMIQAIRKLADGIVVVLFATLSVLVLVQVVCRLFHIPQTWIDEVSKFIFIWLVYMGGAVTVRRGMNITFDLFLDGLRGRAFQILFTFVNICCAGFLVIMAVLGSQSAWINRAQSSSMTGVNMGLMNLAIPIGCLLMLGAQIEYYVRTMKNRKESDSR